jgi:prepilin-type N-terminal cleavage/methylation domain-containing protein/prepilin-type processing-associated H-X9-DG protein
LPGELEEKTMRRKGFALVELVVVIAAVALLVTILVLSLAESRRRRHPPYCRSNLSGIGKAICIYANEDEYGRFPRAGGPNSVHGVLVDWQDPNEAVAFGYYGSPPGEATVTSSLWLLVKGDYATTKQFVCKSDPNTTGVFRHSNPWAVWDFGDTPGEYCSYAYHFSYDDSNGLSYGLSSASNPAMPVCADRNPEDDTLDNSRAHQGEGQTVLFVDGHVDFEKNEGGRRGRDCGIDNDDIYTAEDGGAMPVDRYDSVLVNEPVY